MQETVNSNFIAVFQNLASPGVTWQSPGNARLHDDQWAICQLHDFEAHSKELIGKALATKVPSNALITKIRLVFYGRFEAASEDDFVMTMMNIFFPEEEVPLGTILWPFRLPYNSADFIEAELVLDDYDLEMPADFINSDDFEVRLIGQTKNGCNVGIDHFAIEVDYVEGVNDVEPAKEQPSIIPEVIPSVIPSRLNCR